MKRSTTAKTTGRGATSLLALTAMLALGAAATPGVQPAEAAFPGENGRIASGQLSGDASGQIGSVLGDGSDARILGSGSEPEFSANGAWIVYADSPGAIWRMRADGQRKRRLTPNRRLEDMPTWSPSGKRIAFVRQTRQSREIYTMNRNGRKVRRLTRNRASESAPAWSPDGRWIAFTRANRRGRTVIHVMRPNGRRVRKVTAGAWPSWSPVGKRIAFSRTASGSLGDEIFTVRRNGRGAQRLTHGPAIELQQDIHPEWSPDGRWIVFARNGELWQMRPNGEQEEQLLSTGSLAGFPTWQPQR